MNDKPRRLLTALVILPPLVLLIGYGSPFSFFILLMGITAGVQYEFYRMHFTKNLREDRRMIIGIVGGAWIMLGFYIDRPVMMLTGSGIAVLLTALWMCRDIKAVRSDTAVLALGLLYPVGFLGHLMLIRSDIVGFLADTGAQRVLFLLLVIWGGDAGAYYIGKIWGRRKIAPVVSPNKTIEGAIGGLVCSAVLGGLSSGLLRKGIETPLGRSPFDPILVDIGLAMVLGLFGQIGDLVESLLKRSADIKDSGGIIPAHGGLFDKLDSIAFAAPVFYYALYCPYLRSMPP